MIDTFLSITAFLENILILAALRKECSLHLPSKLLLRNLAITDLCVGIIVQPVAATYWISETMGRSNICHYALDFRYVTGFVLCAVSLMTMTSISVDRLLALLLGLRYRQVVTLKRTYITITILWVGSVVAGTMYFVKPLVTSWLGNFIITPQGDPLPYYIARQSGLVFLYLNSSLNPLLYCWKIKEVRQAVKDTIKQVPFSIF